MAKVLVVDDEDPTVMIEVVDTEDEDGGWDGTCTKPSCRYSISDGGTRFNGLEAAVMDAIVHIDHHDD